MSGVLTSTHGLYINASRRHAIANTLIGVVVFYLGLTSIFHYTGVWYAQFLPISDSNTYDNTGASYNTTRILTPDFTLDEQAYQEYSPLFIRYDPTTSSLCHLLTPVDLYCSTTFAMSYGLSFAAIASLIVYTYLHYSGAIWRQYKNSTNEQPDIHMKLMKKYKEAPTWWFMGLFVIVSQYSSSTYAYYSH